MANFFIRRPIVAIVISILMVMFGVVVIGGLSIEQYPFLAPPNIRVTATYPGASAEAVEQSVATPIEQEVNGVDRLIYMKSSNTSDGRMLLDVNFEVGTDQDIANVLTQNRVSAAQARLPQEVIQQGVTVKKQSPSILMVVSLYSPKDTYDANFLINYCGINLRDQLLRIPGIAQVDLFGGTDYGMRIWILPDRMAKLGLTPADVIAAIKEQNLQAPAGKVGAAPTPKDQLFTNTVSAPGRLVTPEEFEQIIVRQSEAGEIVRIKDIGPRRAWLAGLQLVRPVERQGRRRHGRLPVARRKPAQGRRDDLRYDGTCERALSTGHGLQDRLRHDPGSRGLDPRDPEDVCRGVDPGDAGGLHLPAERPGDDHSADHHSGFPDRHLHLLPHPGLLRQHPLDVRPRTGHRHRGGRRYSRGRGGHPPSRARAGSRKRRRSRPWRRSRRR